MDQPKDAPKPKSPEKKAAPQNNNMLWYLLGLGVLLLLLVTVWRSQNKLTIQWSDLEELIVASNPKAPKGRVKYITHVDETTKPPTQYRLNEPEDIRIGTTEVTGTVMAAKLPRRRSERRPRCDAEIDRRKHVDFRVDRSPDDDRLARLAGRATTSTTRHTRSRRASCSATCRCWCSPACS